MRDAQVVDMMELLLLRYRRPLDFRCSDCSLRLGLVDDEDGFVKYDGYALWDIYNLSRDSR